MTLSLSADHKEELSQVQGIDGYAIFDEECQLIESTLSEKLITEMTGYTIKDILLSCIKTFDSNDSATLFTEKGAWYMAKTGFKYLLILGGYNEPVDIASFIDVANRIQSKQNS